MGQSSIITELFTEKFRPKELNSLIAPNRIKEELSKGLIQNILLEGTPGTGKTTAAYILAKDHTTLYINASMERGIDTIRERISKFCSTISLEGGREKLKCVILDEADSATDEFYKALRATVERYHSTTRFIVTCNYIQKIPEPIQSRFNCISFNPINNEEETYIINEYKKRLILILNAAKITYDDQVLDKFIRNDFPDMRSLLNKVQSLYLRGVKELNEKNFSINYDFEDLFKLCLSKPDKPWENYKLIVSNYASKVDDTLASLGNDFPTYIQNNCPEKINKLPLILIAIAEHQYQVNFVIDKVITLLSCIFKIQTILNS